MTYGLCLWPSPGTEITVETKVQCLRYQGRNTAQSGAKRQPMGPNSASLCDTRWSRQSSMSPTKHPCFKVKEVWSLEFIWIHQWLLLLPQQRCWYIMIYSIRFQMCLFIQCWGPSSTLRYNGIESPVKTPCTQCLTHLTARCDQLDRGMSENGVYPQL